MYFALVLSLIMLLLGAIVVLSLRFLNRRWWQIGWVRRTAYILPILGIVTLAIGIFGIVSSSSLPTAIGMTMASLTFVLMIGLIVSLIPAGGLNILANIIEKKSSNPGKADVSQGRRDFLRISATALPALATGTGVTGFAISFGQVKVYELPLYFENLPPQLDGFRILHLSDMHLGRYFQFADLEQLLEDAEKLTPDMVVATGDICDVTSMLPRTLQMIGELKPRHGSLASIGNHEYYHGVQNSRRAHSVSEVPLLINEGHTLLIDGASLYVGGADDPAQLFADTDDFLKRTIDKTLSGAPSDGFKIIMSHRPLGFERAAEQSVELTLAGHTHGGQIGLGGRSIFETTDPPNYYWGHYTKGSSQLYTSAGAGHWFPFRLGCPAEAPVIILKRA